ncbi:MAG: hypothetical protein WBY53_03045 [Acidobacteriaceae bacterium]
MRVRFAVLLPWLASAVWVVVVGVPAVRTYVQLRPLARAGRNAAVSAGRFQGVIPPSSFAAFAVNAAVVTRSHALTAMNMPGALLEMPVAVALVHPAEWYPKRLGEWTPSLLVMPVCCLPAWWLVGLGLDSLLGWRRMHSLMALLGAVLCAMFLLLLAGYVLGWTAVDHGPAGWVYAGLGSWTAMFAVVPVAWVVQVWRGRGFRSRKLRGRRE